MDFFEHEFIRKTGVSHNDLHPGNVIVTQNPFEKNSFEKTLFYLIDFGKSNFNNPNKAFQAMQG
jgi:predicted unusual protein kinase regulating ubiquinone biosynthesis (AarF/ABC1/UbiB family)